MKDFHDIWTLSSAFAFDGQELAAAVAACFERRRTPWTDELPDVLRGAFYEDPARQRLWRAYRRSGALREPPPESFPEVGKRITAFLGPVRDGIITGQPLEGTWIPGGPWSMEKR